MTNINTTQLQVKTPVFIPEFSDCECHLGEKPLTSEKIQQLATEYTNYNIVDANHKYFINHKTVGTPLKTEILTEDTTITRTNGTTYTYPKGTWFLTIIITDPETIQGILDGSLTGASATTLERTDLENMIVGVSAKNSIKRVLISDFTDPVTVAISIVKVPCVSESIFCEIQKMSDNMTDKIVQDEIQKETMSFLDKIQGLIGVSNKEDPKTENDEEPEKDDEPKFVTQDDLDQLREDFTTQLSDFKEEIQNLLENEDNSSKKEDKKPEDEECNDESKEGDESTHDDRVDTVSLLHEGLYPQNKGVKLRRRKAAI